MFGDVDDPVNGGFDAETQFDPYNSNAFRVVGRAIKAPDLPKVSITFRRKHGGLSWVAGDLSCPSNFYEYVGSCVRPDDHLLGWSDYVSVYSSAVAGSRKRAGRTSFNEDGAQTDEIEFTLASFYDIGPMRFGEQASLQVEREVVDVVFGSTVECGSCGPSDDGTKRVYALTKSSGAGSPGTPAEVVYRLDGLTWQNTNITGLSGVSDPTAIEVVGNFLVVLDTEGNGYYYSELDPITGAPTTWNRVITGFTAGNNPEDITVLSPREIFFCGRNGRVYKSSDITAGVFEIQTGTAATLRRITNIDDNLVAAGDSGTIALSTNRGVSWSFIPSPTSGTIRAVAVRDPFRMWIGNHSGGLWYTIDGGNSWVALTLPGATVVDDIVFATEEVGWIAFREGTKARLYTTWLAGAAWINSSVTRSPRTPGLSLVAATRFNRIAVPTGVTPFTAANNAVVGGLSGGGVDGILLPGVPIIK